MCLHSITKNATRKTGTGWKIFNRNGGSGKYRTWMFEVPGVSYSNDLPTGVWLKADTTDKCEVDSDRTEADRRFYNSGFHIFIEKPTRADVGLDEVLVQVSYRRATVEGLQAWNRSTKNGGMIKSVIAGEMMIGKPKPKKQAERKKK